MKIYLFISKNKQKREVVLVVVPKLTCTMKKRCATSLLYQESVEKKRSTMINYNQLQSSTIHCKVQHLIKGRA